MKSKAIYAAALFAALNICTFAAHADSNVKAETYAYGTHLDIKKVLSSEQDQGPNCGVVKARLTYLDSQDQTRALEYLKISDVCRSQGN
ncbi:MAG: DUF2790 domain-containing protein [Pseudomonas sp.]